MRSIETFEYSSLAALDEEINNFIKEGNIHVISIGFAFNTTYGKYAAIVLYEIS